jgi:hypothetical protein
VLKIEPKKAAMVRAMFEGYAGGESTMALSRRMGMQAGAISRILHNRIYTGRIIYGDVDAAGKHDAIIEQILFDKVQVRLPTKSGTRPQRQVYPYLLAGRVKCACGSTMACSFGRGPSKREYPYYRCTSTLCRIPHRQVRADRLDAAVLKSICDETERDKSIAENYQRRINTIATMRGQNDGGLSEMRRDLAEVERKAANLSTAIQNGTIGAIASKHLAADADALYATLDTMRAQVAAREKEIAETVLPNSAKDLARAWQQTARAMMRADVDIDDRRTWMNIHVKAVQWRNDKWVIDFVVPSNLHSARPGYHPEWLCKIEIDRWAA